MFKLWLGLIYVDGCDIIGDGLQLMLCNGFVYVFQGYSVFWEMIVGENVMFGVFILKDQKVIQECVEFVQNFFLIVGEWWKQLVGFFFGGQQKQVEFVCFLMVSFKVVLLDELLMGFDLKIIEKVFEQVV